MTATATEELSPSAVPPPLKRVRQEDSDAPLSGSGGESGADADVDSGRETVFEAYRSTVEAVMSDSRIYQRRDKEEDADAVRAYLLSEDWVVPTVLPTLSSNGGSGAKIDGEQAENERHGVREEALRRELDAQRVSFLSAAGSGWDDGDVKSGGARHRLLVRVLAYLGNDCAKKGDGTALITAWKKVKESGALPRDGVLSTFLYALTSNDEGYGKREEDRGERSAAADDAAQEIATFHDILFRPTEKTVSLRVKALVAKGDAKGAEDLLGSMKDDSKSGGDLKLRTYLPILGLYCRQGDLGSALALYKRMRSSPGVIFEAENYSMLIAAVAENGYFRTDANPIEGAAELGYAPPGGGPALLDLLASEMAQDCLEITPQCADRLAEAFRVGFGVGGDEETGADTGGGLGPGGSEDEGESSAAPPPPLVPSAVVADRVLVDESTAACPLTGARLRLIVLEDDQRQSVHDTLLGMANDQYEAYSAKLVARNHDIETVKDGYASEHLRRFAEWLDEREGKPFTAVVDGANVAFFGQGVVNHYQVRLVVEALEKMGETPLVVLPEKYAAKKFYIRKGFVQELPQEQLDITQKLEQEGKLYKVPKRCLDDYYWMLASVSNQTASRNGTNLDVSPGDNGEGRWPGLRPIIISNDRMRDHKLELLKPRLFRRWYSSHMIRYEFSSFEEDELDREICFSAADFFSREIQANPTAQPGDGRACGTAWHFPVSGWEWNERFCLQVPSVSDL